MRKVYVDSSILIPLLFENHEEHPDVEIIFKGFANDSTILILISTLTIDEVWHILRSYSDVLDKPYGVFSEKFRITIINFLNNPNIKIIDTVDGVASLKIALEGSIKFNLKPRDSFHYAYAKLWNAEIVAKDRDFMYTDLTVAS
ncbi:MAG: hypothetical protein CO137_03310 [Candidatus Magasanikbacteria bacterium CG_4_9_14_3_um_filter_32_9]|uniref:PIN domain-containing protein n=1 Tax=Candidatus Magasanikbacteria bacterium CG_4_9_14_3_um_filter_32_9 TaxID=1974644 RepID=A0A2M7Z6B1_9BACT|nr:MAG: hypothetical protein CO137_03310 [Candidatus Magasanikbacteria bacterium CG_4_9_14_3_um_filter_32_9]